MPTTLDAIAMVLFTYANHSAAACVVALVAGRLLRRPQDRDVVWKAALVAPFFTTAIALSGNGGLIDLANLARSASGWVLPAREITIRIFQDNEERSVFRHINDPVTFVLSTTIVVVAAVCVFLAGVRLAFRQFARHRLLRHRVSADPFDATNGATIRLSEVDALPSPVAIGSAEVCLPAEVARSFSDEHRRALIAHEIAHLERRDPVWFFAVEVIGALSAFQPLLRAVIHRFRRDVELICDEAAVRRTGNGPALIGALARLASPFDARSPMHGAATAHDGSPLVARAERIATLTGDVVVRRAGTSALVVAAALVAALLALPAVASVPRLADLPFEPPIHPLDGPHRVRPGDVVMIDQVVIGVQRRVIRRHPPIPIIQ